MKIALKSAVSDFFETAAQTGLELRSGQVEMAKEAAEAMALKRPLAVEAEVGIGKSFAYLVPALMQYQKDRRQIVIATSTIALQEQLCLDAHTVLRMLGIDVDVILAKGMKQYACCKKVQNLRRRHPRDLFLTKAFRFCRDGMQDKAQMDLSITDTEWEQICITNFGGKRCRNCEQTAVCVYAQMRSRMLHGNDIVICNHNMLVAHLRSQQEVRSIFNPTIKQLSAPYGYDLLDGQLVVNPEQAEVVRGIFRMYLSGMGYAAIARHLNIDGKRKSEKYDVWTIEAVAYILKNERYIGDSLWQKKYNEGLPFKKYRNYGKYPQFYISGTHEAIIDRESFEIAQTLYQKRQHSPSTLQASPLTMRLYCSHCGTVYSRKRRNDAVIWTCRKHDAEAASCPSLSLCEGTITATFIRMHNKLFMHRAEIIEPMLQMLAAVHQRGCHNDSAIKLHQELAKLREQTHVIAKLRTKGFLSEVKYQEQLAELNRKISKQQKQLHLLTQNDEEDEVLRELEQLEDYFENREQQMIAFEPDTFEMLADKIIVHDRDALEFHLIGGLTLTEPLVTE